MTLQEAAAIVSNCSFPEYEIILASDSEKVPVYYIQGRYVEADTVTGKPEMQYTRKWLIEEPFNKDALVFTAFKCVLTSMEHKTREWFLYENRAIFQPHISVDKLYEASEDR